MRRHYISYLMKFHSVIMLKIIFINTISKSPLKINRNFSYGKYYGDTWHHYKASVYPVSAPLQQGEKESDVF